jgi:hypothetical protein
LGAHEFRTTAASLLMVIGFWAALIGAAWARLGFYLIIGGTVLWTISLPGDVGIACRCPA